MSDKHKHNSLYAAFDLFPTSKGASTHIHHMAGSLFDFFQGGLLYALGNKVLVEREVEGNIAIRRFCASIPNYLQRATAYTAALAAEIEQAPALQLAHFRDIWSGLAILQQKRNYKTLFEVNGFPSIELPYRYSSIPDATLNKIQKLELWCCEQADQIITPSEVIKQNLLQRGVEAQKLLVVPNAAEHAPAYSDDIELPPSPYIIYFGALQPWQGLDTLIKAFASLKDLPLNLLIVSANRQKQSKEYCKLAQRLELGERVIWRHQLEKPQLNSYIKGALLSIAPLNECSRNIDQGCSPLKIFESLACGTPVVASDLPVVREILQDKQTGRLFQPDRPQSLARLIRYLFESPADCQQLAENGRQLIATRYNWQTIKQQMHSIYSQMVDHEPRS